jgi:hypothetical protein
MSLLGEIIRELSNQSSSLTQALLKVKVLLHRVGHKELIGEWVNYELNGYPRDSVLPPYRILHAQIHATLYNAAWRVEDHQIPMMHLGDEKRSAFEVCKVNQSLAEMEKLVSGSGTTLHLEIPLEFNGILGRGLGNGFRIQCAWKEISCASVEQIFVQVRSRLLDFLLSIQDEIGENVPDDELRAKTRSLDTRTLFENAIFGDNTVIQIGDLNTQDVR